MIAEPATLHNAVLVRYLGSALGDERGDSHVLPCEEGCSMSFVLSSHKRPLRLIAPIN